MTDLERLQEGAKLLNNYPDIILTIRNNPNTTQKDITQKLTIRYTSVGVGKAILQMKEVGILLETPDSKTKKKYHVINESVIQFIESAAMNLSRLVTQK